MAWSFTRASTGFSTWDGCNPTLMYKLGGERLENCPAERNSEVLADGKLKPTECPGSQKGQLYPQVHQVQHRQARKGTALPCSALGWPHRENAALGTPIQGHQTIRVCPVEGNQDSERPWKQKLLRSSWGRLVCPAWRTEGWGVTPLPRADLTPLHTFLKAGSGVGRADLSLWWPVIEHEEIEWSCTRGSSDWTLAKAV